MAFDLHANLAISTVVTPPSPASSGTTLTVTAGHGAYFAAVPCNATVWPLVQMPNPVTAEIVRITARVGDTLTITRAQEGTSPRTIVAGDVIAVTITMKTLTDLEAGTNFPNLSTTGLLTVTGLGLHAFSASGTGFNRLDLRNMTAGVSNGAQFNIGNDTDPQATQLITLSSTYASAGDLVASGSALRANQPGGLRLSATHAAGPIVFLSGGTLERMRLSASGTLGIGITPSATVLLDIGPRASTDGIRTRASSAGNIGAYAEHSVNATNGYVAYFQNTGAGNGLLLSNAGAWAAISDRRRKRDIRATALDVLSLRRLQPSTFIWELDPTRTQRLGFIAQEVAEVYPTLVSEAPDGFLALEVTGLIAPLVAGWQQHDARLAALEARR